MKKIKNSVCVKFPALGENESFARIIAAGFLSPLGVRVHDMADIKTMVSEAVTNAIVHGYGGGEGEIRLEMKFFCDRTLLVSVTDHGRGIEDVEKALEPFYTTDREGERSGMGLPIMQAFSDSLRLISRPGFTRVTMKKRLP